MKALLVKELSLEKAECDIVLMFDGNKPCEVNFMRRGNTLIVYVEGAEPIKVRLQEA